MRSLRSRCARAAALTLVLLSACRSSSHSVAASAAPDSSAIRNDIAYLASDALEGRATGSPGNDSAARYIARRFETLGLAPLICDSSIRVQKTVVIGPAHAGPASPGKKIAVARRVPGQSCIGTYFQRFNTSAIAAAHAGISTTLRTQNVAGVVLGKDPQLRHQYVIVGAHYDHLGRMGFGVLDVDSATAIHNGADDNASGTAAVLELARLLARRPANRSVVFVTFSGEELGLLGSVYFAEHSPVPLDSVVAMLNFDMVGRLKDDRLIVYGVTTADEFSGILDSANIAPKLRVTATGDGFGSSDHSSFFAKNLPVLHFFTDVHDDYHRSTDDVGSINAAGEARVVAMAERVLRSVANRPARLTLRRSTAPTARMSTCQNGAALGSIPNMGATDVGGVQLSGVREGSPAQKGGLAAGDIIVEFGGASVKDLYEYQDALCNHKPGDTVQIVIKRNGDTKTLTVTLGKRGS